jgi:hypothetical protein
MLLQTAYISNDDEAKRLLHDSGNAENSKITFGVQSGLPDGLFSSQ